MNTDKDILELATGQFVFARLRTGGMKYVDKSACPWNLAGQKGDALYFISRPRRFGKSLMLVNNDNVPMGGWLGDSTELEWDWRFLHDFSSRLKSNAGIIRFLMRIGVPKLTKPGVFSGLNRLTNLTSVRLVGVKYARQAQPRRAPGRARLKMGSQLKVLRKEGHENHAHQI